MLTLDGKRISNHSSSFVRGFATNSVIKRSAIGSLRDTAEISDTEMAMEGRGSNTREVEVGRVRSVGIVSVVLDPSLGGVVFEESTGGVAWLDDEETDSVDDGTLGGIS